MASATRGVPRLRLTARGRAAHSAAPDAGESAIEKLIEALVRLRQFPLPVDPAFGPTSYNIGTIAGGVAPNVIPAHATAEILFRTVGPRDAIVAQTAVLEPLVSVQEVLHVPPVRLRTVPGLPAAVFPFTTDVPLLDRWGEALRFAPGSFLVAHTDEEHLALDELEAAVDAYERLISHCLALPAA